MKEQYLLINERVFEVLFNEIEEKEVDMIDTHILSLCHNGIDYKLSTYLNDDVKPNAPLSNAEFKSLYNFKFILANPVSLCSEN